MAERFARLNGEHRAFISRQRVFFTATAAEGARINLSPKGYDTFRILSDESVGYLDYTGSGNETAAHLLADGRMTIMFCAFDGPPLIMRLYGGGEALARGGDAYGAILQQHFAGAEPTGARQFIRLAIELVQTSCGYGVPAMAYEADRPSMRNWCETKGEAGLADYRRAKNSVSMDGLPTGLPDQS
jgi:hypothetical protein